ncbi:MAG: LPS-assembly protein LptD [Candidatus Competibacterales bacterium]
MTNIRVATFVYLGLLSVGLSATWATPALGQELGLCPPDPLGVFLNTTPSTSQDDETVRFTAEVGTATPELTQLEGEVVVEQGKQSLRADAAQYDRNKETIQARGSVIYSDDDLVLKGQQGEFNLATRQGRLEGADYFFKDRYAQGGADFINTDRITGESEFQGVIYSTCARGEEFWQLHASELAVDEQRGRGEARNVSVWLGKVPVAYLPYISFPIDDERHTGFLAPTIGQSSNSGLDIQIPYYWNLAPNRDITFVPRLISKRGVLLGAEFRFLEPKQEGEVRLEYLPFDREADRQRGSAYVTHRSAPLTNLYTDGLFQYVSDDDYIDDLDNNLGLLSPIVLERRFDINYFQDQWRFLARLQGFQTVDNEIFDDDNSPYERLPQLLFDGAWDDLPYGLDFRLRSEFVYFENETRTRGPRLDLFPSLSRPFQSAAGFFIPRLSFRYTAYDLHDLDEDQEGTFDRALPLLSLDAGVFLERNADLNFLGKGIQTLEPRLYYLYVPQRDQDQIPLFDTTIIDQSYAFLFLENRFTGADRIGDANQLTAAVTTRFLEETSGRERLRLSLGQIFFFRDRDVTLESDDQPETGRFSDFIAEARLEPRDDLTLRGTVQWELSSGEVFRSGLDLNYRPGGGSLVNAAYRLAQRDDLEQLDLSFVWPINPNWRTLGRWNYSLSRQRIIDTLVGVEYDACCWALRVVGRHFRSEPRETDARNAVYLELELKGLTGIGNRPDSLLDDAILGYRARARRF